MSSPRNPYRSTFDRVRDLFSKKGRARKETRRHLETTVGTTGLGVNHTIAGMPIAPDVVEAFLYDHHILWCTSSCVVAAQYYFDSERLLIEFVPKSGQRRPSYIYDNIDVQVALLFCLAESKGRWVHNWLLRRGNRGVKIS